MNRSASRKSLVSTGVVFGLCCALILGFALVAATYLYSWARGVAIATHPVPQLSGVAINNAAGSAALTAEDNQAQSSAAGHPLNGQPAGQQAAASRGLPFGRINILLLGTDERPQEAAPPRTDTMMVVSLDLEQGTAGMISLPRDLWVPIPGYDVTTKINTAYSIGENRGYPGGGPQLAKDTVSGFIGRPVEYYVRVNFNAFVQFVDLIGGIDIDVPETIHDERYPTSDYGYEVFHIDAGRQHLDGSTALKYVRTRNVDNDYKRAARQQQVIEAVVNKVLQADMIPTLIARAPQLLSTMRDSVGTDMPLAVATNLANYLRQNSLREVRQVILDNRYGTESYSDDGAWILIPDRSRIRPVLNDFFDTPHNSLLAVDNISSEQVASVIAQQVTDPQPTNQDDITDPSAVRLEILNGTGYPGIAARTRELLEQRGWQVVSIGDADRSDYRRTLVVNYHASPQLIDRIGTDLALQSNLPKLNGLIISDTVDLRIVIGQDFVQNVLNDVNQQ
jgi:LCP family protein required for cell wall assembly